MSARQTAMKLISGGLEAVQAERTVINDLNVYPVPDGDTGTNLFLTIRAVVEELEHAAVDDAAAVLALITRGSLMGARGNSGVILSQIVRGACEAFAARAEIGTDAIKAAFLAGSTAAYRAVREPVEGTMLTVIKEMAAAAQLAPAGVVQADLLARVADAGRLAVERTTHQLAVLRQAGVVDAGGYGLLVLLRGIAATAAGVALVEASLSHAISGDGRREAGAVPGAMSVGKMPQLGEHSELSRYRYCTSLLLSGQRLSREALEEFVAGLGESGLVVGDESMLKIHVHVDDPGAVLSHAVTLGTISDIEIEDMHHQTRQRDERLAAPALGTAVIAVVAGAGNATLFRQLGCAEIVDGGQSMNPSAAELLTAIEAAAGVEVVVLPNNSNVALAAEQAAGMSERRVAVVATGSMPAGLSAMVAFDPARSAADNASAMAAATAAVSSGEVTTAVRDSVLDGRTIRQGQTIGLVEGRLVAAGDELGEVFTAVMAALAGGSPEIVTVLASLDGSGTDRAEIERLAQAACPEAEVVFYDGGQPLYSLLIGVE